MTLSEQIDRLLRICALIRALYVTQTEEQHDRALERLREAMKP